MASALSQAGWRVTGFGREAAAPAGPALANWRSGELDRAGLAAAIDAGAAPALIVHCAGAGSVGAAQSDPDRDFRRTLGGLSEVLAMMRDHAPDAKLVLLSSAAVYGAGEGGASAEAAPLRPISVYGVHKQMAEAMATGWVRLHGLDVAVIRFFSVYGPGLRKQLFWDLHRRLAAAPAKVELGGTGEEARDFIHIDDAVRLVGLAAGAARRDEPLVVNGGSGQATTVRHAAETLAQAMGGSSRIVFSGRARPGDPRILVADPSRMKALGFAPAVRLEDGLADYAAWAAAHG